MTNEVKKLPDITLDDWVDYQWQEVTAIGDPVRSFQRLYEKTPLEKAQTLKDIQYLKNRGIL